ncbi:MAG TPA: serine/threonine-protein kinase [Kofleriaceae bacterium]|nr:serine/threonine-protein kinase [Kofleriaceae bacterium]
MALELADGSCIGEDDALALIQGTLDSGTATRLRVHAEECASCRALVAALARMPTLRRSVPLDSATPTVRLGDRDDADRAELAPGEMIAGRYVIHDVIGAGGMGVVYTARDTSLERTVALKRVRGPHAANRDDAHDRLVHEARTMAKLSHPSVVAVFDAGVEDGAAYVAMEYVDGTTLRGWLGPSRTWRQIVGLFAQAARGLAAAHDAGIVHGDFKPDNVLVDRAGRPRVADFGLARAAATGETIARGLAGTPAYMAPEQLAGEPADARTDQFAFWVSLHEALYGSRPTSTAKRADEPAAKGPAWLKRALRAGLDPDPARRHPSMTAVAQLLERGLVRRRTTLVAAALIVTVTGAGGLVVGASLAGPSAATQCRGATRKLDGVWDPGRRVAVHGAFLATHKPHAKDVAARVEARLDAWTERWTAASVDACEATRVHGEQSEAMLDLRTQCLDRQLGELDALVTLFQHVDGELLDRAATAAASLTDPAVCADTEALAAGDAPTDPALRARIATASETLARARALDAAGRYDEGTRVIAPLVKTVDELGPFAADVLSVEADLEQKLDKIPQAVATLDKALLVAERTRQDRIRAQIQVALVWIVGSRQAKYDAGREHAKLADAILARLPGPNDALHGDLLTNLSAVAEGQGKFDEVITHTAAARARLERAFGPDNEWIARTHLNTARALEQLGKYEESRAESDRALAILVRTLGPDHPDVAMVHVNIGNTQYRRGDFPAALRSHQRALEIRRAVFGPRHAQVGESLVNVGTVLEAMGEYERALQHQQDGLDILVATLPPEHPMLGVAHSGLANSQFRLGRYADALGHYQAALDQHRKVLGDKHPTLVGDLFNMGLVLQQMMKLDDARDHYTRALDLAAATLPPDHLIVGYILSNLGGVYWAQHRPAEAIPPLERALALREAQAGDAVELAGTRWALARALWDANRDRPRAVTLARAARDALAKADRRGEPTLAEVTAWLKLHDR